MASFGGRTDGSDDGCPRGDRAAVGLPEKPPGAKRMASFGGRTDGRPHEHDLK
jgi:hypothetical protein